MKKALLIILAAVLLLVPVVVYAVGSHTAVGIRSDCLLGADASELTEQQEADLEESFEQMIALRKETVDTMVHDGLLSEEQGQRELERLDEMLAHYSEHDGAYYYGVAGGCYGEFETQDEYEYGYGRGMMHYGGGRGNWD